MSLAAETPIFLADPEDREGEFYVETLEMHEEERGSEQLSLKPNTEREGLEKLDEVPRDEGQIQAAKEGGGRAEDWKKEGSGKLNWVFDGESIFDVVTQKMYHDYHNPDNPEEAAKAATIEQAAIRFLQEGSPDENGEMRFHESTTKQEDGISTIFLIFGPPDENGLRSARYEWYMNHTNTKTKEESFDGNYEEDIERSVARFDENMNEDVNEFQDDDMLDVETMAVSAEMYEMDDAGETVESDAESAASAEDGRQEMVMRDAEVIDDAERETVAPIAEWNDTLFDTIARLLRIDNEETDSDTEREADEPARMSSATATEHAKAEVRAIEPIVMQTNAPVEASAPRAHEEAPREVAPGAAVVREIDAPAETPAAPRMPIFERAARAQEAVAARAETSTLPHVQEPRSEMPREVAAPVEAESAQPIADMARDMQKSSEVVATLPPEIVLASASRAAELTPARTVQESVSLAGIAEAIKAARDAADARHPPESITKPVSAEHLVPEPRDRVEMRAAQTQAERNSAGDSRAAERNMNQAPISRSAESVTTMHERTTSASPKEPLAEPSPQVSRRNEESPAPRIVESAQRATRIPMPPRMMPRGETVRIGNAPHARIAANVPHEHRKNVKGAAFTRSRNRDGITLEMAA